MDHYTPELVAVNYILEEVEAAGIELEVMEEAVAHGMAEVMEVEGVLHMREVVVVNSEGAAEVVIGKQEVVEVGLAGVVIDKLEVVGVGVVIDKQEVVVVSRRGEAGAEMEHNVLGVAAALMMERVVRVMLMEELVKVAVERDRTCDI
uniref:Uncharacterized protein n=1 Tax=Salix viminalis TaxID=40686 RepID=A0A6N2L0G3_SALVM